MQKHTPGPWKAELTLNEWAITGPDDGEDKYSGVVVFSDAGVNGEANARLIAAAPDLLAACEALGAFTRELLKLVTHEQIMDAKLQRRMLKVNDQAYNAIAKAKEGGVTE